MHAAASAWELAYLTAPWWRKLPMSSYALSLRLLDNVGYWDSDVIADEWHMALKTWFMLGGQQQVQPIYLPFWANTPPHQMVWGALRERYWQTFRHAWGAQEIGYTLALMLQHRRSLPWRAWALLGRVAHDNMMAGAGWLIIFFGSQLPVWFHPDLIRTYWFSPAGLIFQAAAVVIGLLTLWFGVLDLRLRPPRSTPWPRREWGWELASLPLLALLTLITVVLPVLHAQTRLMLGKPIEFRVTRKL
jgi:hypothetical protein